MKQLNLLDQHDKEERMYCLLTGEKPVLIGIDLADIEQKVASHFLDTLVFGKSIMQFYGGARSGRIGRYHGMSIIETLTEPLRYQMSLNFKHQPKKRGFKRKLAAPVQFFQNNMKRKKKGGKFSHR